MVAVGLKPDLQRRIAERARLCRPSDDATERRRGCCRPRPPAARHRPARPHRRRATSDVAASTRPQRIRRRFAARQLELHADRLDVAQLGQRRQLVQALRPK